MEIHSVYCSARDRNVHVAFEWVPETVAGAEIDPASGVCLGYCSRECTGSLCALFDLPPSEMLARLRAGGLLPAGVLCHTELEGSHGVGIQDSTPAPVGRADVADAPVPIVQDGR